MPEDYTFPWEWSVSPMSFLDTVLGTIKRGGGRRRFYRRHRDNVLRSFAPMGLDVAVQAGAPLGQYPSPSQVEEGQIAMYRAPTLGSATYLPSPDRGLFGIAPDPVPARPRRRMHPNRRKMQRQNRRQWANDFSYLMSHELGHVLGLNHAMEDPTSVMNYANQGRRRFPSARDLELLSGPDRGIPEPGDPGFRQRV